MSSIFMGVADSGAAEIWTELADKSKQKDVSNHIFDMS